MPVLYYCGKLFKDKPFPSVHSGLLNEGSGAGHGSWTTREALSFPGNAQIFLCFCDFIC